MYTLVSYLANPERELQFLRSVAEVVILILLPPDYSRCVPVRQLLREILACHGQSTCWGPAVFGDDKGGGSVRKVVSRSKFTEQIFTPQAEQKLSIVCTK